MFVLMMAAIGRVDSPQQQQVIARFWALLTGVLAAEHAHVQPVGEKLALGARCRNQEPGEPIGPVAHDSRTCSIKVHDGSQGDTYPGCQRHHRHLRFQKRNADVCGGYY
jgi:hypothetical protein